MGEWTGGIQPECPAIAELRTALIEGVPLLAWQTGKIGTVRDDGSRHTAGVAMDIMLDSRVPEEKSSADQIIDALIAAAAQMRWGNILYTDWQSGKPAFFSIGFMPPYGSGTGTPGKRPNTNASLGTDHINHIHIDWWGFDPAALPQHSRTTGFKTSLVAELVRPPKWLRDYMGY